MPGLSKTKSPWSWIPSLYFIEGLPYFLVNTISIVMLKDFGMDNGSLALLTSLISLPWVIKPFWSPFVDIFKSKRWWVVLMQALMALTVGMIALFIPKSAGSFSAILVLFTITAFASATHDIAADGLYMLGLESRKQASFIGIRNTFYRIAMVFGQGVLVVIAGILEKKTGDNFTAWKFTILASSIILAVFALLHGFSLPHPADDGNRTEFKEFANVFKTFFSKKGILLAMAFMLLYRLPEALSIKMLYPFFSDSIETGGLGLGKETFGIIYGTLGVIACLVGGILGGLCISKYGLKKSILAMALSLALPCGVYLYMAMAQPASTFIVGSCVMFDQLGYGFGFSAYMMYLINFSAGDFKTSHYSLCTGFMALSMILPGLVAGYIQEALSYTGFFIVVMLCCTVTIFVSLSVRRRLS